MAVSEKLVDADVPLLLEMAFSIVQPVPAVIFRRLSQDIALKAKLWWRMLQGEKEWMVVGVADGDEQKGTLYEEMLIEQMRSLLSKDLDQVRLALRWAEQRVRKTARSRQHATRYLTEEGTVVEGYWFTRPTAIPRRLVEQDKEVVMLYMHGGGFAVGTAMAYAPFYGALLERFSTKSPNWPLRIFSLEYGLAPEHQFPCALNQAVAAYKWLVLQGERKIIVAGDSAGGNLALGLMLKLREDCKDVPLPIGILLISPWTDMSFDYSEPCCSSRDYLSMTEQSVEKVSRNYLGDRYPADLRHPYVSPVYGSLQHFPPMLVNAGGGESMLSQILEFVDKAKSAGVNVTLDIGENMFHVYPNLAAPMKHPKALAALDKMAEFVASVCEVENTPLAM